ncbi:response regulator [Catenovulum adriaticum]|uniref:Response regulator n=1 Tax=Catenovulum adriaticum TaxID=2984846 RepID=A0ABY7AKE0_9ALTE|nr:response regulator [Catenovulum sp. TS8]WAJ69106.1 response regulator [Catenovulum sp. TS8]
MPTDILLIDDDKMTHKFIESQLEDNFNLYHAYNGDEGIDSALSQPVELILLDIEMPGQNGYQVCEKLKQTPELGHVPVIFLSGKNKVEEILKGYEAGADDFIVKPFDMSFLQTKLWVIKNYYAEKKKLSQKIAMAENTAFTAMTGNSELGQVMGFVEKSYGATVVDELAKHFLNLTKTWGLNCLLYMELANEDYYFSSKEVVKPLEKKLMQAARLDKRFVDFGARTIINYPKVSVLIKNMPVTQLDTYGRLKDLFPSALGATDAKLHSLEVEKALTEQANRLTYTFHEMKDELVSLTNTLNQNQQAGYEKMRSMFYELESRIPTLGLDDDQEKYILDSVMNTIEQVTDSVMASEQTNKTLSSVLNTMQNLVDEQAQIVSHVKETEEKYFLSAESVADVDIELF